MSVLENLLVSDKNLQPCDGYWKLLAPEFESHLDTYLPTFEKYRASIGAIPTVRQWKELPFGRFANDGSWRWRRESLVLLQKLTRGQSFTNVLEIGCWNGWLTKFLAARSQAFVGIDYFTHPTDGIGNIETIAHNITALQCNLEETSAIFKPESFDLIVVNHCLSYSKEPTDTILKLIPLLQPNGKIISLGNAIFGNPQKKIAQNQNLTQRFEQQFHLGIFIQPVKGFIDQNDVTLLERSGFETKPYRAKWLQNVWANINPLAPSYVAFVYQKK